MERIPVMEPRLERDVQKTLRNVAEKLGITTRKMGGYTMYRGAPDLLLLGPGPRHGWIEVKREGGQLTELQAREHEVLRDAGFFVGVVYGDPDIERVLAAYLRVPQRWGLETVDAARVSRGRG
jgi:hypothetical protein